MSACKVQYVNITACAAKRTPINSVGAAVAVASFNEHFASFRSSSCPHAPPSPLPFPRALKHSLSLSQSLFTKTNICSWYAALTQHLTTAQFYATASSFWSNYKFSTSRPATFTRPRIHQNSDGITWERNKQCVLQTSRRPLPVLDNIQASTDFMEPKVPLPWSQNHQIELFHKPFHLF